MRGIFLGKILSESYVYFKELALSDYEMVMIVLTIISLVLIRNDQKNRLSPL